MRVTPVNEYPLRPVGNRPSLRFFRLNYFWRINPIPIGLGGTGAACVQTAALGERDHRETYAVHPAGIYSPISDLHMQGPMRVPPAPLIRDYGFMRCRELAATFSRVWGFHICLS